MSEQLHPRHRLGKISVIMPAYNAQRFIREAVRSVLAQTYQHYEIIIVDDGSTDTTQEALAPFLNRITLVHQKNAGPSAARNRGLEIATGEFACFLDADDLLLPCAFETLATLLQERPGLDVGVGRWDMVDQRGQPTSSQYDAAWSFEMFDHDAVKAFLVTCCFPTMAALSRMHCVRACGGWDENLRYAEDRDVWLRLALQGCPFGTTPTHVGRYRRHPANSTLNVRLMEEHASRFLQKWFSDAEIPSSNAGLLRPYAHAMAWIRLARHAREASLQAEMGRCSRVARDCLVQAVPDDAATQLILWSTVGQPWEHLVIPTLWRKSPALVAEHYWMQMRGALRRRNVQTAAARLCALLKNHPRILPQKLRRFCKQALRRY